MSSWKQYRAFLDRKLGEYNHAIRQGREEELNQKRLKAKGQDLLQAQQFLQEVAETVQNQAHRRIASVVSRCLEAVFQEDAYEFRIEFSKKRGRTEARLLFLRDGMDVDPTEAAGGGVVDVAAFALRLACLCLSRPQRRKLLLLDEPFRFVSAEYRTAVKELVETLAKEMNMQFVIVTHSPDLVTGKVVEL